MNTSIETSVLESPHLLSGWLAGWLASKLPTLASLATLLATLARLAKHAASNLNVKKTLIETSVSKFSQIEMIQLVCFQ